MADRFKFAEVRQEVIEMLKKDLLGPSSENEILNQNPRFEYIVGMLAPQTSENDSNEQEIDGDASFEGDADYTAGEDDDNEPVFTNRFKTPSSIGISFYLESSTKSFNVDVTWGDYTKASDKTTNKEGKEVDVSTYKRHPQKETVVIDLQEFSKNKEYPLVCDSNVILYVSKIGLKQGYTLITAYVNNKRKNPESDIAGMMFQVNLRAYSQDKMDIFVAEHICRKILAVDEFYFAQRPILGRGRGCAATWKANKNGRASEIVSTFIPEYEFPGVSAALEGFDPFFFSMRTLSVAKKKDDIINRLNVLANSYEDWIQKKLIHDSKMDDAKFKKEIGDTVINKCIEALGRIRAGIQLLVEDDTAFDAFCFMNRSMILQRNIMNFSKKHGAGIECAFRDFVDPRDPSNNFGWRPFQIAFILMNLKGIVDPEHDNREVVDLLYFPTGGGKTEAYLGLMAFVIANRRLRAEENDEYNRDGGVTAILRYTLRLLTTQQRDRITKMILAAELIRQKEYPKYGKEPISIGFWVGGTVTPNTFKELEEAPEDPAKTRIARSKKNSIYKQLLTLYNPYRPRDLSHYENFTGYHAQLYRFVEGTTATPFSARARDRVLHALVISAIRLHYPEFASNDGAAAIDKLTDEQLNEVKALIMNRLNIIKPSAKADAEHEIDDFISNWKLLATQSKELRYYVYTTKTYNRLMNTYGEVCTDLEKPTLRSMRDVERAANMFYYTED